MNIREFINQDGLKDIGKRLKAVEDEYLNNTFNVFSFSTKNPRREEFHSEILAMLLNPDGIHKQNNLYLDLFIDYLNKLRPKLKINKDDFINSEVSTEESLKHEEKGRIDIFIKNKKSMKAIIIENKINNATDMDNQLGRYYNDIIAEGYDVQCVVYLTPNKNKTAPRTDNGDLNNKIVNIAAYTNKHNDNNLFNGWLQSCIKKSEYNKDCFSFLYQYGKLLKQISNMATDRDIKDNFYEIINQKGGLENAQAISKYLNELEIYRADIFIEKIGEYSIFQKKYRHTTWQWCFELNIDTKIPYKLDVRFFRDIVTIDFWLNDGGKTNNETLTEDYQKEIISKKLQEIGLLSDFNDNGFGGGMWKKFCVTDAKTIKDVDDEVLKYVEMFFEKLRNICAK
ncbi:MAG: PD-(D/E)XK nuclease family protein [Prevotellaceae bacterium]|jgi:hypothetical protein|nr:PD-(D/E)XK nuclease family protein [Prevotellaceae bacterium]